MAQADEILQRLFGDGEPEKVASQESDGNASADYLKLAEDLEKLIGQSEQSKVKEETEKIASSMNEIEKVAYVDVIREALLEAADKVRRSHGK